jgi:hypothetical protein
VNRPDQRKDPRYVTNVPIAFRLGEVLASESSYINNLSASGAAFNSMVEIERGAVVMLHLPPRNPVLRTPARVVWTRKMAFHYTVGVEFLRQDEQFRTQMVEMVRRIETFRNDALRDGRYLDEQQAAIEWIEKFARDYFGV